MLWFCWFPPSEGWKHEQRRWFPNQSSASSNGSHVLRVPKRTTEQVAAPLSKNSSGLWSGGTAGRLQTGRHGNRADSIFRREEFASCWIFLPFLLLLFMDC